jgi:putative ABC transport system ATP-binding protein
VNSDTPLVRVRGVSKVYESPVETIWAARNIDFTARAGQFVCIFGASGSGKSTFLNILSGLDVADHGDVEVDGVAVHAATESVRADLRLRSIGMVFQDHQLIDEFTAVENVALPLEAVGTAPVPAAAQAREELRRVGLDGLEDRLPVHMSGGQRQRVGVARALVGQRRILLGDEPTGALDSASTLGLFALFRTLADGGALVIMCSHDPRCRDYADTIYEMVDGVLSRVTELQRST